MARRTRSKQNYLFIECRTYGHAWDEMSYDLPDDVRPVPEHIDVLSLRCGRCTTRRYDWFNKIGDVVRRRYIYPNGYKRTRDETLPRAVLRLMLHGWETR